VLAVAAGADVVDRAVAVEERRGRGFAPARKPARPAVIDLRRPRAAERADLGAAPGLGPARVGLGDVDPGAARGRRHEAEGERVSTYAATSVEPSSASCG